MLVRSGAQLYLNVILFWIFLDILDYPDIYPDNPYPVQLHHWLTLYPVVGAHACDFCPVGLPSQLNSPERRIRKTLILRYAAYKIAWVKRQGHCLMPNKAVL